MYIATLAEQVCAIEEVDVVDYDDDVDVSGGVHGGGG